MAKAEHCVLEIDVIKKGKILNRVRKLRLRPCIAVSAVPVTVEVKHPELIVDREHFEIVALAPRC